MEYVQPLQCLLCGSHSDSHTSRANLGTRLIWLTSERRRAGLASCPGLRRIVGATMPTAEVAYKLERLARLLRLSAKDLATLLTAY